MQLQDGTPSYGPLTRLRLGLLLQRAGPWYTHALSVALAKLVLEETESTLHVASGAGTVSEAILNEFEALQPSLLSVGTYPLGADDAENESRHRDLPFGMLQSVLAKQQLVLLLMDGVEKLNLTHVWREPPLLTGNDLKRVRDLLAD